MPHAHSLLRGRCQPETRVLTGVWRGYAQPRGRCGSCSLAGAVLALFVGLVESSYAKLRFFRVPELMAVALGLGFLALAMRFF